MISFLIGIICLAIGYFYRDLRDSIKDLYSKLPKQEPEIGATHASYGTVNSLAKENQGGIGVFTPKTPQQLEWEEQERLREAQLDVKVKPSN